MDFESLFTASKWKIIEEISQEPQSPLQIAEKLDTSIANVSQQLRLLEAAGIVSRKRLSQREKGKPRVLFSIADDFSYIITAADGFSDKKLLKLDQDHGYIVRVWHYENMRLHEELIRFYLEIKPHLKEVKAVGIDVADLLVLVETEKSTAVAELRKKAAVLDKAKLKIITLKDKVDSSTHILFDPKKIMHSMRGERDES